jgi:hypothetical protein
MSKLFVVPGKVFRENRKAEASPTLAKSKSEIPKSEITGRGDFSRPLNISGRDKEKE